MKITFLFLLSFFNSLLIFCQSFSEENDKRIVEALIKQGDSLKKTDTKKAHEVFRKGLSIALDHNFNEEVAILYKKIGTQYYLNQDFVKADRYYNKGLNFDSISKVAADLNYNASLVKEKLHQGDSAMVYLEKSLRLYEKLELNNSGYKAFLRAGYVYKDLQLYTKALKYSIKAYEGFKKDGDNSKLADACTTIGNIQNQMGHHYQALNYHFQALELEKNLDHGFGKGICYTNIASVYDDLKMHDSAIANYQKALVHFDKKSGPYAKLLSNMAITYCDLGNKKSSVELFNESIKINQNLRDTISLLYNYNGITHLFLKHNSLKQARRYLDMANHLLPVIKDKRAILSAYENEAEYHKKVKDYRTALAFQLKYSDLYKEVYNTRQAELVQTMRANFEYEQREDKIQALNLKNKNAQLLLSEKNESIQYKNLTLIILGIIILLVVIIYQFFLQRQKTAVQTVRIEKLEAIYDGQEIIKKRIARDLHDIITTNFDGLRLRVLALKRSSNLKQSVDGITDDLKKMNLQIRMVSHRLYPLEMYMGNQKFTDIIKSRLSEFQLYGNVFVELEDELPDLLNGLSIGVQNNLYGILLEVLNNVEKHAHATTLNIKNSLDDENNMNIVFEDNGIGITNKHKEGIGLMNIKQRVEILEGTCNIGKTKTGTKVHINFPVKITDENL
ncbi:hypothetical protein H7U19_01045 [Hyunsoonleella sp. SJ7]|uniref:Histidine kinase/HSP90-like ATPase domain-containing protein n=1 Tax=Hyunsoonleella aquatilis TaxID=2762758 RepID=A0A923H751_9FLAO|nr:tetratricopeptide repeat-containing sensor histidine kinase [Hyunsoonleella aquatilis]MBC3756970.1 hypothetical protein [Hyunsoonleella aquatilis]